jgi:hypothetical protein
MYKKAVQHIILIAGTYIRNVKTTLWTRILVYRELNYRHVILTPKVNKHLEKY